MSTNNVGDGNHGNHEVSSSPGYLVMAGPAFSAQDLQELLGLDDENPGALSNYPFSESGSGEDKAVARTERKRSREKQRRCDVNRQFTDLTTALRVIEAESEEFRSIAPYVPSNRAELIARTVVLVNQLHESNKRRKTQIADLEEQLAQSKKAGEETAEKLKETALGPQTVGAGCRMVMIPMMLGMDGSATPATGNMAAYGQGMQFMMPMPAPVPEPARAAPMAETGTNVVTQTPWGMLPPWMMQHVLIPPSGDASTAGTSRDQKKASDSSAAPIGSNLAHCA
jgi:hypothetical protein